MFNSPAVFGSVKNSFNWIKKIVETEMKEGFCTKLSSKALKKDQAKTSEWQTIVETTEHQDKSKAQKPNRAKTSK